MKFYAILLAVLYMLSLNAKVKSSSVYHVRKIRFPEKIVPVPHQIFLSGLRRRRMRHFPRCFHNNMLIRCQTSLQINHLIRLGSNRDQNKSNININEKSVYERIHGADRGYIDLISSKRLTRPLVNSVNKMNLKLVKPHLRYLNLKPLPDRLHILDESPYNVNNLTNKVETLQPPSEIIEYMKKSPEKIIKYNSTIKKDNTENTFTITEDIKASSENIEIQLEDTMNKSFEQEQTTPKPVENSVLEENVTHNVHRNIFIKSFIDGLDQFERRLYATNFNRFLAIAPASKGNNGMSFVQSGLFLNIALMALSTAVDIDTKIEIDQKLGMNISDVVKIKLIKQIVSSLPNSSEELKYRCSSRLVLRSGLQLSREFRSGTAEALQLKIDRFNGTQPELMAKDLNRMIEEDSDGAIRDTFDEEDLSDNEQAVFINTLHFRARWRSAPTLLNGTSIFRESENALPKPVRMIRINDIMKYADLPEWDAEAIEVPYLTQGLSLLMLVPRGNSLRHLAGNLTSANFSNITERMQKIRIAVVVPLYTLRMTLLLPSKLQAMGISRIVDTGGTDGSLRISQAVQRIMFWAEAGRNAYKDDGLEWDATPEMKIVVNRPYIFCVRWKNLTLMLGNFVL